MVKVVSVSKFEELTGIHVSDLCGKMENVKAISTYAGDNPSCRKLSHCGNDQCVCTHCYSVKQVESKVYKNQKPCLERNGRALTKLLKYVPDLSRLKNHDIFRFESHGDVINVSHARNYIRIAKANPQTNFGAWTKRPNIWEKALAMEGGKPVNLHMVYSSPMINVPAAVQGRYPFFDSVFTVYEKDKMPTDSYHCRCGKGSCNACRFCYTKAGHIAEALR